MPAPRRADPGATAIVLAGGRSIRFGSDKLAALLDGRPLLEHAVEAAAATCGEVLVVGGDPVGSTSVGRAIAGFSPVLRHVADSETHPGPLVAILAAAEAARGRRLLVVGGDMPWLQRPVLERLLAWRPPTVGATLELAGRPQQLPLGLDREALLAARDRLRAAPRRSLRSLLEQLAFEVIAEGEWRTLDPTGLSLRDIDRPEDMVPPG